MDWGSGPQNLDGTMSIRQIPGNVAMTNKDDSSSAVDVIRCVYLARMLERRGDHQSALRWQAKADMWLEKQAAETSRHRTMPVNDPARRA